VNPACGFDGSVLHWRCQPVPADHQVGADEPAGGEDGNGQLAGGVGGQGGALFVHLMSPPAGPDFHCRATFLHRHGYRMVGQGSAVVIDDPDFGAVTDNFIRLRRVLKNGVALPMFRSGVLRVQSQRVVATVKRK